MSMIGHLRQITPAELEGLKANPSEVLGFLGEGTTPGQMVGVEEAQALIGKFQEVAARILSDPAMRGNPAAAQAKAREEMMRLMGRAAPQAAKPPSSSASMPGGDSGELNLDKAWHGIHFLLTGKIEGAPPPLGNAIMGGTEIGEDLGYGPARYLTPEQVQEVALALAGISTEELASRYDPQTIRQAGVYAMGSDTTLDYCVEYFEKLVAYYGAAARQGNAMLLYLD